MKSHLQSYILSAPDRGDLCVVTASGPMQAAALAVNALEDAYDDDTLQPLLSTGWPTEGDIREIDTSTRSVAVLS